MLIQDLMRALAGRTQRACKEAQHHQQSSHMQTATPSPWQLSLASFVRAPHPLKLVQYLATMQHTLDLCSR